MKNKSLTVWMREQWNRLPRGGVESPYLQVLKACKDTFLCNQL